MVFSAFSNFPKRDFSYLWKKIRTHAHARNIMSRPKKELTGACLIFAALLWAVLAFHEECFLRKVEDLSLFMFNGGFILDSLQIPGGILSVAGSFLTQFLHLPWLGSLIWILSLLASARLTAKAFDIPSRYSAFSFIPAAILVISNMSLGYGVFIMRVTDHFFGPTLGYITVLIPVLAVRNISRRGLKAAFIVFWAFIAYPLTGIYAIAGTLSAGVSAIRKHSESGSRTVILPAVSAVTAFLIPLVCYNFYTSFRLADAWTIGLPSISDTAWSAQIGAPYYILLALAVIAPLLSGLLSGNNEPKTPAIAVQIITTAVLTITVSAFWFRDSNFRTELAMSEAIDSYDWQKAVDIFSKAADSRSRSDAKAYDARTSKISQARSNDEIMDITDRFESRFFEPTRTMVMYRDLALLKLDKALDQAFSMKDGGRAQKSRTQIPMAFQSARQLYLNYGLENMCYRWCMEDMVEYGWSFSTLRYMAEYAIVTHEYELAGKYLDKLSSTLFYRKWAQSRKELTGNTSLINITEPYRSIAPYMCFENRMSNDMVKPEVFLINHFLAAQPVMATPEYDRAALLFAMRTQDINSFWERLMYYVNSNKFDRLPRAVQEAALLYSSLEKDVMELQYDKTVRDSYDAFNRYVNSHPIRSLKEASYPYCKQFGKTFFYFYYFIRNLQTY